MEFQKVLSEAVISTLRTSFSSIKNMLPKGWIDSASPIEPFGSNWGRGVYSTAGEAVITSYGTKHAVIKQRMKDNTDFTFYWGYIPSSKTLYLDVASIRGNGLSKKNVPVIISAILDRMKYTWQVSPQNILWESNNIDILHI